MIWDLLNDNKWFFLTFIFDQTLGIAFIGITFRRVEEFLKGKGEEVKYKS